MTQSTIELSVPLRDSFRVRQIAGMFDVPLADKLVERFAYELPALDEPWEIGLIVGPSGTGKSTIARHAFGAAVYESGAWPDDAAVVDALAAAAGDEQLGIKQLIGILTAVGLGSPPAWIKPYHVLSNGERFRCDLARALVAKSEPYSRGACLRARPLVVFDEFTSVVDRHVARACAAAVSKAVRQKLVARRFVAVTCHRDVEPWLAPDWTFDTSTGGLVRRRLRRPSLRLEVRRCRRELWPLFARHHYLSGGLSWGARCYAAFWNRQPLALCAVLAQFARRGCWRISRLVTLPEFQGLGIGCRLAEAVGDLYLAEGLKFGVTAAHPALVRHCLRSPNWRLVRISPPLSRRRSRAAADYRDAQDRTVATFAYLGDPS